jgi:hypothetical protein
MAKFYSLNIGASKVKWSRSNTQVAVRATGVARSTDNEPRTVAKGAVGRISRIAGIAARRATEKSRSAAQLAKEPRSWVQCQIYSNS